MANSDNVIRAALTRKFVDPYEFLDATNFGASRFRVYPSPVGRHQEIHQTGDRKPTANARKPGAAIPGPSPASGASEVVFPMAACPFVLSVLHLTANHPFISGLRRNIEIHFCTEGTGEALNLGNGRLTQINQGTALLVPASVRQYRLNGEAVLYKASVSL
jgi:mannose-6-phosphate isomerase class I